MNNNNIYALSVDKVLEHFKVNPEQGLSDDKVKVMLGRYGFNILREVKTRNTWKILIDQFKSIVIIVLAIAGLVAFAFQHWAEGAAIAVVILVNALLGFFTEWKAVRSMEALQELGGDKIRVRRDGEEKEIDVKWLVPGDIVVLDAGDLSPADVRLIESNNLQVNEATLTGESAPVLKQSEPVPADTLLAERKSMIYMGTTINDGSGEGVVSATGMETELGRISEMAESAEKAVTPLQKRLNQLGRRLAWITVILAMATAGLGLLAGRETTQMIETAIALGVAAIPESLPIVATIALAWGMHLMAKRNALINKLPAVETLGATRVIFTDKTGTLTKNEMTLRRVDTPAGNFEISEAEEEINGPGGRDNSLLRRIIEVGVLCNNACLPDTNNGHQPDGQLGDPLETALLRAGLVLDMDRERLLEQKPEEKEVPFDSRVMMMATYHRSGQGVEVNVKGAPERVLNACSRMADEKGEKDRPLDDEARTKWLNQTEAMAGEGLRVLAIADKMAESTDVEPYVGLRFLGLIGLMDPPREEVLDAIRQSREAGIRVVMVTGDQPATAAAIARKTEIVTNDDNPSVIHGNQLKDPQQMSDEEHRRIVETSVFARVSPKQKLHLVKLMQDEGETVAMIGDGVNDTPSLKKADIGIAMGKRGTDAARQAADMVLLDDAFPSIVAAVHQGRIIFSNIRKSVMFMLCTNMAEIIAVASASFAGAFFVIPIPLLPLQILYLNVVTDVFPALALGIGKGGSYLMQQEPRPREEPVLTRSHWLAIGGWSILLSLSVLAALSLAFYLMGFNQQQAVTVSFLTLAFGKLWFVFNLRNPGSAILDNDIVKNPYIAASILLSIVLLLVGVYVPGLSGILETSDPGLRGWVLILVMSLVPFLFGQGLRIVQARKN